MPTTDQPSADEAIRTEAARWTVLRDRGLSAKEAVKFQLWLATDERHAEAMRRCVRTWSRLDRLPDRVGREVLQEAARRRAFWQRAWLGGALAAAAMIVVAVLLRPGWLEHPDSGLRTLALRDGTTVRLNVGGEIVEQFTPAERRVKLVRGEANFAVTKNPARPFIVQAGEIEVRAVGTAFNVHLQSGAVDVLVTEGVVKLNAAGAAAVSPSRAEIPLLSSGHRAVVALAPSSPDVAVVVTTMSPEEISHALAWQEPLLRLGGATLAELVVSFERRTGRRVILADPGLADLRLGGRIRADDVEGFTSLLETVLEIDVRHEADGTMVLRKKKADPR